LLPSVPGWAQSRQKDQFNEHVFPQRNACRTRGACRGYKQSGIGREECLEELISFTQEKNININLAPARKS